MCTMWYLHGILCLYMFHHHTTWYAGHYVICRHSHVNTGAVVEEVLKYFTQVKAAIPQSRNTLLQVKSPALKTLLESKHKSISIKIYFKYQK